MSNNRINQLAFMLSDITKIDRSQALEIIKETDTGKAILDNNMTILYEQQTENLEEVAVELRNSNRYPEIVSKLTTQNIVIAGKNLRTFENECAKNNKSKAIVFESNEQLKNQLQERMKEKRKSAIAIKRQNKVNEKRMMMRIGK